MWVLWLGFQYGTIKASCLLNLAFLLCSNTLLQGLLNG
jgi:hypothetical protein